MRWPSRSALARTAARTFSRASRSNTRCQVPRTDSAAALVDHLAASAAVLVPGVLFAAPRRLAHGHADGIGIVLGADDAPARDLAIADERSASERGALHGLLPVAVVVVRSIATVAMEERGLPGKHVGVLVVAVPAIVCVPLGDDSVADFDWVAALGAEPVAVRVGPDGEAVLLLFLVGVGVCIGIGRDIG